MQLTKLVLVLLFTL